MLRDANSIRCQIAILWKRAANGVHSKGDLEMSRIRKQRRPRRSRFSDAPFAEQRASSMAGRDGQSRRQRRESTKSRIRNKRKHGSPGREKRTQKRMPLAAGLSVFSPIDLETGKPVQE